MGRWRPLVRAGILCTPLLVGGCMSGILPGSDGADPSCLLLCALTRAMTGTPAPAAPVVVAPAAKVSALPSPRRVAEGRPSHAASRPRHRLRRLHVQAVAHRSVVPQAPARPFPPRPVAIATPVPPAATQRPGVTTADDFGQSIPGSALIVAPGWRMP